MLDSFELEINTYLRAGRPLKDVAQMLRELWERGGLSPYDQNVIALFLAKSGQLSDLFSIVEAALEKESRVPWPAILEAFRFGSEDLTKEVIDFLLVGCGFENRLNEIALATHAEKVDPRFKKLKWQAWDEQRTKCDADLEIALEKLEQLRRERLFDAEEKFLEKLHLQFPTHPKILAEFNGMKGRRALGLLERRNRDVNHGRVIEELNNPLGDDKLDDEDQAWAEQFTVLAEKNPSMAYDLGIALVQMGLPQLALKALSSSPSTRERDSLILDLMIQTRQFVDALEFAENFDRAYTDHEDTAFSAMYIRARAIWGLGEKIDAIQMLTELLKLRPTYRSAHALLLEWKGSYS